MAYRATNRIDSIDDLMDIRETSWYTKEMEAAKVRAEREAQLARERLARERFDRVSNFHRYGSRGIVTPDPSRVVMYEPASLQDVTYDTSVHKQGNTDSVDNAVADVLVNSTIVPELGKLVKKGFKAAKPVLTKAIEDSKPTLNRIWTAIYNW